MQNFVSVVTLNNYESFIERSPDKHKVIFFSDTKSTPALIKAVSKRFLDKVVIGEIKKSDKLTSQFKVN